MSIINKFKLIVLHPSLFLTCCHGLPLLKFIVPYVFPFCFELFFDHNDTGLTSLTSKQENSLQNAISFTNLAFHSWVCLITSEMFKKYYSTIPSIQIFIWHSPLQHI